MVKRISVLLVLLIMVDSSFGAWLWWTNDGGDQDWTNVSNWTAYPTAGDDVVIQKDTSTGPILGLGDTTESSDDT